MSGNILQHFVLFSFVANGIQIVDHMKKFAFNADREHVSFCSVQFDYARRGGGGEEFGEVGRRGGQYKIAAIDECAGKYLISVLVSLRRHCLMSWVPFAFKGSN